MTASFQVNRLVACGSVRLLAAILVLARGVSAGQDPATSATDVPTSRSPVAVQSVSSIDFVRRARTSNSGLAAARLDLDRARARLRQAGRRPNPTLDFERRTGRLTGSDGEGETTIGVALPLELFGQRGRRIDLAEAEVDAAEAAIAERERQLASDVRARYAEALAARREVEIIDSLGTIEAEMARLVAARVSEGDSAPLEYRLVQVEMARLDSRRAVLEGTLQSLLVELRSLAGFAPDDAISLAEDLTRVAWSGNVPSPDEAIATALRTRPDLRLARLEERVAEAGLRLARADAAPEVTAFTRFSVEKSVFDDTPVGAIHDRDRTIAFGVSIVIPVLDRNQGGRAEAETAIAQARKRREYAEQRVRSDVLSAHARVRAANAAVAAFEQGVIGRSNDNLRSIRGAYQVGAYRITELLAEQRRFADAQREYTETLAERFRALADLQAAIGLTEPFGERKPAAIPEITSAVSPDYPGLRARPHHEESETAIRRLAATDDARAIRTQGPTTELPNRGSRP